jgi:hypothetical protein
MDTSLFIFADATIEVRVRNNGTSAS